jgi:hypothetical protein
MLIVPVTIRPPDETSTTALTSAAPALPPLTIDVRPIPVPGYRSPLEPHLLEERWPTALRGGLVVGDIDRAGIAARVAYYRLPWWRRVFAPRPPSDRHLIARDLLGSGDLNLVAVGKHMLTRIGER